MMVQQFVTQGVAHSSYGGLDPRSFSELSKREDTFFAGGVLSGGRGDPGCHSVGSDTAGNGHSRGTDGGLPLVSR